MRFGLLIRCLAVCCLFVRLLPAGSLAELESAIRTRIQGQPGAYAVAVHDLSTGEKIFVNAEARVHSASLMKVPVMMTAFHLAEYGLLDLDRPVKIKNSFASLVDGSSYEVSFDPEGPLSERAGQTVALSELIRLMIVRSDNVATNLVMEFAGADRVREVLTRLGIAGFVVRRGVEDNKAYEAGLNNECNARSVLAAIVACRESQFFSAETRRRMMAILESQELDSMISNGIPAGSGAVVGHKTGSISSVEHDAGIVRLANGKAYGIVILTWNFGEQRSGAVETGTAISAMVFRYFSGE